MPQMIVSTSQERFPCALHTRATRVLTPLLQVHAGRCGLPVTHGRQQVPRRHPFAGSEDGAADQLAKVRPRRALGAGSDIRGVDPPRQRPQIAAEDGRSRPFVGQGQLDDAKAATNEVVVMA